MNRIHAVLALMFCAFAGTTGAQTTPTFAVRQEFAPLTSGDPRTSVAAVDVNDDGKRDLITVDYDTKASVALNTGATGATVPSFGAAVDFEVGDSPWAVTAADVNDDGKPDLLVANSSDSTVSVLLNAMASGAAAPAFAAQETFDIGDDAYSIAAADINADGLPDVVTSNADDDTVSVLLNTTTGGLASFAVQQTFLTGDYPNQVEVADLDGDGRLDLVVPNWGHDTVSVLLNTTAALATSASFAAQQTFATGDGPYFVAVADFNGDGKPDLVVADSGDDTASVLLNTTLAAGTVSFAPRQVFAAGSSPYSAAAADVNGDGKPDALIANYSSDDVTLLLNTTATGASTATFTPQSLAVGDGPNWVIAADMNGDCIADVLTADNDSSAISVLLNATPGTCGGSSGTGSPNDDDFLGIGGFDFHLLLTLLGLFACKNRSRKAA